MFVDKSKHACSLDRLALEMVSGDADIDDTVKQALIVADFNYQ